MIPKIIHYCWFGGSPIPSKLEKCIETWVKFCPDYELKLWNEENFDVNTHIFTKTAYEKKKYAYVADYVRAYALDIYGGVYLDTDVELKASLDTFLEHEAFTGFERKSLPFTAVWGAKPNHSLTKKVLNIYTGASYNDFHDTNTKSVSNILITEFGINANLNEKQIGSNGDDSIHIYPAETFCLDLIPNIATHHFDGSWMPDKKSSYKEYLHTQYYLTKLLDQKSDTQSYLKAMASELLFHQIFKVFIYRIYYNFSPKALRRLVSSFKR